MIGDVLRSRVLPASGAHSNGVLSLHQRRSEVANQYQYAQQAQHECKWNMRRHSFDCAGFALMGPVRRLAGSTSTLNRRLSRKHSHGLQKKSPGTDEF
jgi:hypothetical protein